MTSNILAFVFSQFLFACIAVRKYFVVGLRTGPGKGVGLFAKSRDLYSGGDWLNKMDQWRKWIDRD